jgi:hypothetical protein
MKYFITSFIFILSTSHLIGQTPSVNQQLLNIIKKSDIGTNAVKYSIEIGKTVYNDNTKLSNDINLVHPNLNKYNSDFQKTITYVKSQSDRDKIIFKSVEFGNSVIMSPVYSVPVLGNIMKEINNQIFDAAEKDLKRNYEKKLAYSLEELRKNNQAKYNDVIKSKDYTEVKKALDEVNFFSNQGYKNLAPEFQELIEKSQQKFLQESVNTTLKRILDDVGDQKIEIEEVTKKINGLSQFTYEFAKESNIRFEALVKTQDELNIKVNSFYKEYQKDKKALDFMQDFMYSKMNTKEKINALESGLFPGLNNDERYKLKAELAIVEKREEVINTAQEFLNSASISLKIANDLGLGSSPLVQDLSTAISYGQAAFGAVTSFMSGNYLQAISSITGLFGGGGPDIAEQRHKQIMERFDRIDIKLEQIDKKLDILIEGQKTIIENQQKTFDFLIQLADNINTQHIEIMNEFKTVENAIYINRELIMEDWESKCQSCLEIIKKRLKIDIDTDLLPPYDLLKKEYTNIQSIILPECEKYTGTYRFTIGGAKKVNPHFYLSSTISGIKEANKIVELINLNTESFNLLFSSSEFNKSDTDKQKLLTSLFYPSTSIKELDNKFNCQYLQISDDNYKTDLSYFPNLLSPYAISRHGYVIRNIGFLVGLTDGNRKLIDWDMFSDKKIRFRNFNLELNEAIQLNNVSIAQQTLLSGDILLPILYNNLEVKKGDTLLKKISRDLLVKNSTLATNFVNYYFFKRTNSTILNQSQYSYIYNSKDSLLFSNAVLPVFPVEYIDSTDMRIKTYNLKEGWHMIISSLPYRIPEPSSINNISLVQTESLTDLIENRNKLYKQLKSYTIYNGLSSEQITNLNYMIIKTQD